MFGVQVEAGEVLTVGTAKSGARCYIAVGGGFDAPVYLGSRATFPSGNLGGYQGRPLAIGDTCELGMPGAEGGSVGATVPDAFRPGFGEEDEGRSGGRVWKVTMLQGPQTAPDYFTEDDMKVCVFLFILVYLPHFSAFNCKKMNFFAFLSNESGNFWLAEIVYACRC